MQVFVVLLLSLVAVQGDILQLSVKYKDSEMSPEVIKLDSEKKEYFTLAGEGHAFRLLVVKGHMDTKLEGDIVVLSAEETINAVTYKICNCVLEHAMTPIKADGGRTELSVGLNRDKRRILGVVADRLSVKVGESDKWLLLQGQAVPSGTK